MSPPEAEAVTDALVIAFASLLYLFLYTVALAVALTPIWLTLFIVWRVT